MAVIDVVKWDGNPDVFAWKFPEENLSTFTQLIVYETQEAYLFSKGQRVAHFTAGKHTLSTENIPLLRELYGLPFGGENPFTAEVWFINKVCSLDVKWGTPQPFQVRDPEFSVMIPLRAYGQFGIQIGDGEKFLQKLVGTLPQFDKSKIDDYFRGFLLSKITAVIAKKIKDEKLSVLDLATQTSDISDYIKENIQSEFDNYGIHLLNFYVSQISFSEDDASVQRLKDMLSRRAEMQTIGYNYQQERSYDVLEEASKNTGTLGGMMGMGAGMGMGLGAGNVYGRMMDNAFENPQQNIQAQVTCSKCGKQIGKDMKFCPSCGKEYNPCSTCGTDVPENAEKCPKCGAASSKICKKCNTKNLPNAHFCSMCGASLENKCSKCDTVLSADAKFCPNCGQKVGE